MTKKNKTTRRMVSVLCVLCILVSSLSFVFADPSVTVRVNAAASNVANMKYKVVYGGEPITEEVAFDMYDAQRNLVRVITTENGEFLVKNVPFGTYVLDLQDDGTRVKFTIKIDETYLLTAHEQKTLDIKPRSSGKPKPVNPFVDVEETDYFYEAVMWGVTNGITSGTSATTFSPDGICTRAQAVTFLWNIAGRPKATISKSQFTDLDPSAYYYDAVLWAAEKGITVGTTLTTFSPEQTVTRAQNMQFLWKYAGKQIVKPQTKFVDVNPEHYFYDAVAWAVKYKITSGTTATTFSPNDWCTRAQIMTFLYKYMK